MSSFRNGIPFDALPRTFQDAISIARELDIKYIWIDSLCIIQDSPEDWRHESGLMASVYSNSYLNVAATGSSNSSRAFLSSRNLTHNSVPIPPISVGEVRDEVVIFVRPSLSGVHMLYSTPSKPVNGAGDGNETAEAPLLSRAWVFQERHLAPRTLHFHPSELVMECCSGLRCECSGLDSFTSNPLRNFDDLSYTSWFGVVEAFSRLRLTYPSDRLEALTGVAKVFWESQRGAYLKGVWGGDAAKGLLWNVTRYNQRSPGFSATRRQGNEVAPIWSWASMVLAEGNKVFFPAGDDGSFASDERFEFLDTDPPSEQSLNFETGPGAIWIKGSAVNAIACVGGCVDEQNHDAVLIFEIEFDDMVIITTVKAEMDVPPSITGPLEETAKDTSCLLVGRSMVDKNWESNQQATYLCMLVLQPCSDIRGAWERIGVLDIREDLGILQGLKVERLKLV